MSTTGEIQTAAREGLTSAQRRHVWVLTLGAMAVFVAFRWLPTGTNLSHGDFRIEGDNVLEFCDPAAPQFLPVTTARSPVTLAVTPGASEVGQRTEFSFTLKTSMGKPIAPVDLLVAHTRKLHLMAVDPTLQDYHHIHPEPGISPGDWVASFAPRRSGTYRIFADFTPTATARGLYASVDLAVTGTDLATTPSAGSDDYRFDLNFADEVLRARQPLNMTLGITHVDGDVVHFGEVMGAFAHLVAFDIERSGFAHLHPRETDLTQSLDARNPELHFQVTIPEPGDYLIWAQLVLNGAEVFVPFRFEVSP